MIILQHPIRDKGNGMEGGILDTCGKEEELMGLKIFTRVAEWNSLKRKDVKLTGYVSVGLLNGPTVFATRAMWS